MYTALISMDDFSPYFYEHIVKLEDVFCDIWHNVLWQKMFFGKNGHNLEMNADTTGCI